MLARITVAIPPLAVLALVLAGCQVDTDVKIEIAGHRWERSVVIEKLQAKASSAWCNQKPEGAYEIKYTRKVLKTKKVEERTAADGKKYTLQAFEEYSGAGDQRVANDGTTYSWTQFKEFYKDKAEESWALAIDPAVKPPQWLKDAKKKAKDAWDHAAPDKACKESAQKACLSGTETTYDLWCEYKVDMWAHYKDAKSKGSDVDPYWPETEASTCKELGCVRKGAKAELYYVDLSEVDIQTKTKSARTHCSTADGGWSVEQWRGLKVGHQSDAKRRVAYGLLCGSIHVPAVVPAQKRLANDGHAYAKNEFVVHYGEAKGIAGWQAAKVSKDEL